MDGIQSARVRRGESGSASYEGLLLTPFLLFIMAATFLLAFDGLVISGTEHGLLLGAAQYREERNEGKTGSAARQSAETLLRSKVLLQPEGADVKSFQAHDESVTIETGSGVGDSITSGLVSFIEKIVPMGRQRFEIQANRPPPVLGKVIPNQPRKQFHTAEAGTWVWDEWRMLSGTVEDPPEEVGSLTGDFLGFLKDAIELFFYTFGMIGQKGCW